jgi:hypothetical protein
MTDEEIKKNFDVVAGHLATLAVGLDTLREQVCKVSDKLDRTAEGITSLLAIAEIHDREIAELAESVKVVSERQREADRLRHVEEQSLRPLSFDEMLGDTGCYGAGT